MVTIKSVQGIDPKVLKMLYRRARKFSYAVITLQYPGHYEARIHFSNHVEVVSIDSDVDSISHTVSYLSGRAYDIKTRYGVEPRGATPYMISHYASELRQGDFIVINYHDLNGDVAVRGTFVCRQFEVEL